MVDICKKCGGEWGHDCDAQNASSPIVGGDAKEAVRNALYDAFHNMSLHPELYPTMGSMKDYAQELVYAEIDALTHSPALDAGKVQQEKSLIEEFDCRDLQSVKNVLIGHLTAECMMTLVEGNKVVDLVKICVNYIADNGYMKAASPATSDDGWRTIDEAKTDGNTVQLWSKSMGWIPKGHYANGWGYEYWDDNACETNFCEVDDVTHYRPLPKPPTMQGA